MDFLQFLKQNNLTLKVTTKVVGTLDKLDDIVNISLELKATDVDVSHECIYLAKSANGKHELPYVAKVENYGSYSEALMVLLNDIENQKGGVFDTPMNDEALRTFEIGSGYDLRSTLELLEK